MTSEAGHHGGGSQLYPNQGSVKIKAARENVLSRQRALFQVLSSICFYWQLPFLCSMAFMLTLANGEEQTGIRQLLDPANIWDRSSVVNFETTGLCLSSSTEQLPMQHMNTCIPHGHVNTVYHSPDPLGCPSRFRTDVKVVMTVWAIIGGIGLAGWMLYKCWPTFTEADINMGLMSEPAAARRSNPTFEILPSIE